MPTPKHNVTFALIVKPEGKSGFVQCTVTNAGQKVRFSLGGECSRVPLDLWDVKRSRPKGSTLHAVSIRQRMEQAEQVAATAFEEGTPSLDTVKALVLGLPTATKTTKERENAVTLFSRYLKAHERDLSRATANAYRTTIAALAQYERAVGSPLNLAAFRAGTPRQVEAAVGLEKDIFEWLVTEYGFVDNTAYKAMGRLSAVLAWHDRTGRAGGVKLHTSFKTRKAIAALEAVALTPDEVFTLEFTALPEGTHLWHARNLFVLACHCGLRFSDWTKLDPTAWREPYQLVVQTKTGHTTRVLHTDEVRRNLKPYEKSGWPAFMHGNGANVYVNRLVKEAALVAGLDRSVTVGVKRLGKAELTTAPLHQEITTHTARRTFTTGRLLAGDSVLDVAARTGHRDIKMVQTYDRTSPEQLADKFSIRRVTDE